MEQKPAHRAEIDVEKENLKPKELTPLEKEIAESLENFEYLETKDKVFLLLVWRGLKKASPVSVEINAPESAVGDLEKITKKAGLFFKRGPVITKKERGLREGTVCFVANSQKDLDLMSDLWFRDHDNDPGVYKELGRMSGFPQTAIDTYDKISKAGIFRLPGDQKKKALEDYTITEKGKRDFLKSEPGVIPFSWIFYMSKENEKYEVEMETARRWAEEVESVSKSIYKKFTAVFYRSAEFEKRYEK